jgi:hypothetical protein
MPLSVTTVYSGPFTPNGVTTIFPFDFKALDPAEVAVTDSRGDPISGLDYAVEIAAEGGNVVFGEAPEAADLASFFIASIPTFEQDVEFTPVGIFNPRTLQTPFDRTAVRDAWLKDRVDRAISFPMGEDIPVLPVAEDRAGRFLAFGPGGAVVAASGTGSDGAFRGDVAASGGAALVGLGETSVGNLLTSACYPETFGVVDDPNYLNAGTRIDQTAEIQAWLTYAKTNRLTARCNRPIRAYSSATLYYDPSAAVGGQRMPDIDLSNLNLSINATPGFVLGSAGAWIDGTNIRPPNVLRSTLSWVGAPNTMVGGVVYMNIRYSTIYLSDARRFPVGHQYWSEGRGFERNTFIGGVMVDNRFGEVRCCVGAGSYINENVWLGGSCSNGSDSVGETASVVVGTYSCVGTGGSAGSNNNRVYGRSYEGSDSTTHPGVTECIPVWYEGCGGYDHYRDCRVEGWQGPIMHVRGNVNGDSNAIYGVFIDFDASVIGDIGAGTGLAIVRQVAGAYGCRVTGPEHSCETEWSSGPLRDRLYSGGGADAARVSAPIILREGTSGTDLRETTLSNRYQTNIYGVQVDNGVIGTYVDTTRCKDFEFIAETLPGNDGRWVFAAYDANLTLLGATHTDAYATERRIKFGGANFSTLYGGTYLTSDDSAGRIRVTVSEDVKFLFFGIGSGTNPAVVNEIGFKAFLPFEDAAGITALSSPLIRDTLLDGLAGQRSATANPATAGTHGFWGAGQVAWDESPTSGQPMAWMRSAGVALGVPFATSTAFAVKGQVVISDTGTKAYYVKTPGTTSGSGTGPNGTSTTTDYTDGTVVFRYIGAKAAFTALANVP